MVRRWGCRTRAEGSDAKGGSPGHDKHLSVKQDICIVRALPPLCRRGNFNILGWGMVGWGVPSTHRMLILCFFI